MFLRITVKTIGFFVLSLSAFSAAAQSTEFTFQGRLTEGSLPATAIYDFEFRLFAAESGGSAIGTVPRPGVGVNSGVFTVKLDFGASFDGTPRWLEIAVRSSGGGSFTTLAPRQTISSTPYAIRSLASSAADTSTNSLQLGGVPANQFVVTTDTRLSDARDPLPNSPNYINNTTTPQASANFNVSGNGALGGTLSANVVTSVTQFNIGFNRALALGTASVFAGRLAGASNTTGSGNSFFGDSAGRFNTTTSNNSFFGRDAGLATTANNNSFFGAFSGDSNASGTGNSFFGFNSGAANTSGNFNAFFGHEAGLNTTVTGNSFFGADAGRANTNGIFNSFFGRSAGELSTADRNSFFGYTAGRLNTAGENNSFFGALAGASNTAGNNNAFFGESAGEKNTTGVSNTFLGRLAGNSNTSGERNVFVGANAGLLNSTGSNNVFIGRLTGSFEDGNNLTIIGANAGVPVGLSLQYATVIGADAEVSTSNTVQLGRINGFDSVFIPGLIRVNSLGLAGSTNLCRNASNIIATCSSSLRYKTGVRPFTGGLEIVRLLRPITFQWKDGSMNDVGFGAEDVARVEPLLTTRNTGGEIEGVKYAQITTVLVNAVNEQQAQIEKQTKEIAEQKSKIEQQQTMIDALRIAVCSIQPQASVCKEERR